MTGPHVNKRTNTQVHSDETKAKIGIGARATRLAENKPCTYGCGMITNNGSMRRHINKFHEFVCKVKNCSTGLEHRAYGFCITHWVIEGSCRNYGISMDEYYMMYESQNGFCAICKTFGFRHGEGSGIRARDVLMIDHNHLSGEVRGLLCSMCNYGIGAFKDSEVNCLEAVKYLTRVKPIVELKFYRFGKDDFMSHFGPIIECPICSYKITERKFSAVDHDHSCCEKWRSGCGMCIRGIICNTCNVGLGQFKDDPNILQSAANYLRKYES